MEVRPLAVFALLLAGCLSGPPPPAGPGDDDSAPRWALSCPPPCVRAVDDSAQRGAWEPHVAVNPLDPLHIVAGNTVGALGAERFWLWAHVSRDGGRTWAATRLPGGPGADPSHPLAAHNAFADPVVAFLPDGTLLFVGIAARQAFSPVGGATSAFDVVVLRSPDGGGSFPEAIVVARGEGAVAFAGVPGGPAVAPLALKNQDKPWIAVGDGGVALLAWTQVRGQAGDSQSFGCDLRFAASNDAGRTWSAPALVADEGCLLGAAPVVAPDGTWHLAYAAYPQGEAAVASSRDRGERWEFSVASPTAGLPALALAPRDGGYRLYVAAAPAVEGVLAPTLAWSDDGGRSWSEPVRLDAPGEEGRILPAVVADAHGGAVATFLRQEGGATQLRAVRVGSDGSVGPVVVVDSDVGGPGERVGDYMGLAPTPLGAFAVWVGFSPGADLRGAALALAPEPSSGR
ncbi:MAG TPA: hypothetical protein VM681_06035 [Candidatus Thermoplasmatota archaeon]|nr:hypothetical protein [Candidatus Thermoplasmatota archaeon]